MEYQKIANLLHSEAALNTLNQPSKFRTKNWVEINDESRRRYSVNRQINFKASMLRSSLWHCSDAYILAKGNVSANNTAAADADANNTNKKVIFKNCAPSTDCISKINNTYIDNAQDIDIVMPTYNLIEYSENHSKTSGRLWQYYKDDPSDNIAESESFKYKIKSLEKPLKQLIQKMLK